MADIKSQSPQTGQVYFNCDYVYPTVFGRELRHNPLKRVKFISIQMMGSTGESSSMSHNPLKRVKFISMVSRRTSRK